MTRKILNTAAGLTAELVFAGALIAAGSLISFLTVG